MLRIVLIRPGTTDLEDQGRIKGTLDVPLNVNGAHQAAQTADDLAEIQFDALYTAPSQSALQTAEAVGQKRGVKVRQLDGLRNLDQGLWHGKLIEEVRRQQPKVYRRWQDNPETVCPPGGEPLIDAQDRVEKALVKLLKKHTTGNVAIVAAEPVASLIEHFLKRDGIGDLWKAESRCGDWRSIQLEPAEWLKDA